MRQQGVMAVVRFVFYALAIPALAGFLDTAEGAGRFDARVAIVVHFLGLIHLYQLFDMELRHG